MTQTNPVIEAIHERRSIRKFTDQPISKEDITTILEAGRWAPSGLNNQPWRYLVLTPEDARTEKLAACTKYQRVAEAARCLICIFLDREKMYSTMKDHQGAGATVQNMLLAAHSLDLGAVWLGEIVNQSEKAMKALDLPEEKLELQAVIALGHPDQKGASHRIELKDLMLEEY